MLGKIVVTQQRTFQAARIEMLLNGPRKGMQWVLSSLTDVWDNPGEEWDGKESAQEWFNRTEAAFRTAEAEAEGGSDG